MEFSLTRLFNLMKMDFLINRKFILLSVLALFGICGMMVLFTSDGAPRRSNQVPPDAAEITYFVLLLVCGCLVTALIFREFRSAPQRLQFLAIPASNFEKVFSKWLYTLPFYLIVSSIVFVIGYQVFGAWVEYATNVIFVPFKDLRFEYFEYCILAYFISHSVVFFFSVIFNNFPIPKIIVTALLCGIVAFSLVLLFTRVIMHEQFIGLYRGSERMFSHKLSPEFRTWLETFLTKLPYYFAMIGVPFIWVISYFKMKEKEA